jgi:hypothetical protein
MVMVIQTTRIQPQIIHVYGVRSSVSEYKYAWRNADCDGDGVTTITKPQEQMVTQRR